MANPATATAQKTDVPTTPTAPASPESAERAARRKDDDSIRSKCKAFFEAFQTKELGLDAYSASILAAHVYSTTPDCGAMNEKELVEWALEFKRLQPILWQSIKNKNLMGFASQLKRHRIDASFAKDYANMATIIRS